MPDNPIVREVYEGDVRIVVFQDGRTILEMPSTYDTYSSGRAGIHVDAPVCVTLSNLLARLEGRQ